MNLLIKVGPEARKFSEKLVSQYRSSGEGHEEWVSRWKRAWDAITHATEDSPEEKALLDEAGILSNLITTLKAKTGKDMVAQCELPPEIQTLT